MTTEHPAPMPYIPAPSMTRTYHRADGEAWDGEYAWLTRLPEAREYDDPGPVEVIEETWQRTTVRRFWHLPEPWAMTCEFTDDDGDCDDADVNGRCTGPVTGWWRSPTGHWHQVCATHQATPPGAVRVCARTDEGRWCAVNRAGAYSVETVCGVGINFADLADRAPDCPDCRPGDDPDETSRVTTGGRPPGRGPGYDLSGDLRGDVTPPPPSATPTGGQTIAGFPPGTLPTPPPSGWRDPAGRRSAWGR